MPINGTVVLRRSTPAPLAANPDFDLFRKVALKRPLTESRMTSPFPAAVHTHCRCPSRGHARVGEGAVRRTLAIDVAVLNWVRAAGRARSGPLSAGYLGSRIAASVKGMSSFQGPNHMRKGRQRWLAKFGQVDKWSFCLRAARMPRIRSDHDETSTPDP